MERIIESAHCLPARSCFIPQDMGDITELLSNARNGDQKAFDALFTELYPQLHRIARLRMAASPQLTLLDTTGLVNECYLKLIATSRLTPADRGHFLAYGSQVMRSIIVDAARARAAERRGGGLPNATLSPEIAIQSALPEDEVLGIHKALHELAILEPRLVEVVEMRYFGGLTEAEIAEAMDLSERTVRRDWEKAKILLAAVLK